MMMRTAILTTAVTLLASATLAETVAELHEKELNAIDTNNDGFLSKDEFDAFSDYAFQAMDEDKNGTLGLDEAKPFLHIRHFQNADRNNDNFVSRSEFDQQMRDDFLTADQDESGHLN